MITKPRIFGSIKPIIHKIATAILDLISFRVRSGDATYRRNTRGERGGGEEDSGKYMIS